MLTCANTIIWDWTSNYARLLLILFDPIKIYE